MSDLSDLRRAQILLAELAAEFLVPRERLGYRSDRNDERPYGA